MLLEDMPLVSLGEINLAVNGSRFDPKEFTFHVRDDQRAFLSKQLAMSNLQSPNLRMFITTEQRTANDPGQAHDREMLIEYKDGSRVKLSFDSGMSLFSPYIDKNWDKYGESYQSMIKRCQKNLGKNPYFGISLIFKYLNSLEEKQMDSRFIEAMEARRIKLLQ